MTPTSDFELIDRVVCRAEEKKVAGGDHALRIQERRAIAIWAASGIIGNGGFQYYFENELSCEETAEGYESIGMPATASVFRVALSLFPEGKPHTDWAERLAFIRSKEDLFTKLSAEVWSADPEMIHRLAIYLRAAGITEEPNSEGSVSP